MSSIDNALKVKDRYEDLLTEYTNSLRENSYKRHSGKLEEFSKLRNFSIDTIKKCGIFYIEENAEMLIPKYLEDIKNLGVISETNLKPIFRERYVIPIKTVDGKVQNLVGYSKTADERYIYGTSKYYRRKDTMWGLENLYIAYELGYAIVVEGITDAIRLRDMGYLNTFAMCGTHMSDYIMRQLNRCRHGIIRIPDRDDAGLRAVKGWECNRHLTVLISLLYKDIDEMCREGQENIDWFNSYMTDCINWIKSAEHMGLKSVCETVTIM